MLQDWPEPQKECLGELLRTSDAAAANSSNQRSGYPMSRVIRSKGFCWLHSYPSAKMYWSHAGRHMQLNHEGVWWGALTEDQIKIFNQVAIGEYEKALKNDWDGDCADRRQEVVFIGQRMDETAIRKLLDSCLVTDTEFTEYKIAQEHDAKNLHKKVDQEVRQD